MGLKVKKWLTNSQFKLREEWQMVYRPPPSPAKNYPYAYAWSLWLVSHFPLPLWLIGHSIDLAGLAHRKISLTLHCFLTWKSNQSDEISPPYTKQISHPPTRHLSVPLMSRWHHINWDNSILKIPGSYQANIKLQSIELVVDYSIIVRRDRQRRQSL